MMQDGSAQGSVRREGCQYFLSRSGIRLREGCFIRLLGLEPRVSGWTHCLGQFGALSCASKLRAFGLELQIQVSDDPGYGSGCSIFWVMEPPCTWDVSVRHARGTRVPVLSCYCFLLLFRLRFNQANPGHNYYSHSHQQARSCILTGLVTT